MSNANTKVGFFREQVWDFAPHERSPLPGSPANPEHPTNRRVIYGMIGVLIGVTAGLGTALIAVNLPYLQGSLGLYQNEIAWLPAVYVMTNVPAGIMLIKYRQQFGLRSFCLIFQGLYCVICLAHVFAGGFAAAIAVRAASGIAGSALTTLALNYMIQAFPAKWRLKSIAVGIAVPQLAIPIARLFSSDLLAFDQWRTLYLFEFGLAAISFSAIAIVRLPPAVHEEAFEWMDLPTVALFTAALTLLCAVLAQGRWVWWFDSPWIGWALAASIPLFGVVFVIEFHRSNPIIDMRWLGTLNFLRFFLIGTIARIVLSEQTYGSVGLLNALGTSNEQLYIFSALTVIAAAAGVVVSALLISPGHITQPVALAIGIVAVAAYFDSYSSSLTRAPQLYFTQILIAFSTTLYIGPAILIGFTEVLIAGGKHLTSFIVLFSTTQSLGGLIGTALLSTVQAQREKLHSFDITQHLTSTDPQVARAIENGATIAIHPILDPALRAAHGLEALSQRVTIEANVLAYNDVFELVSVLSAFTACLLLFLIAKRWWKTHRTATAAIAAAAEHRA
jgi:MFS family permease